MNEVHKGHCKGCPFDIGQPETETAYNLGCLPGVGDINADCKEAGKAWACHAQTDKVCFGHAKRRALPLLHMKGIHRE